MSHAAAPRAVLHIAGLVLIGVVGGVGCARSHLDISDEVLATATPEVLERVRANPYNYFRLVNREWTTRVCEMLAADLPGQPVVQLHGDAHVEQFAYMSDAWGLDDFDDATRGPAPVDIVRFLGSIDLATRQRDWTSERDAAMTRFLDGYRRGLSDPAYRPSEPELVRELRARSPMSSPEFLAWGEKQMEPMEDIAYRSVLEGMEALARLMRAERSDLPPEYFAVVRAGWVHFGVGSALARRVLIRVQGRTADPADDELFEAKEVSNLDGLRCLDEPSLPSAVRVIDGTRQLGRLKHDILAVGPTLLIAPAADRTQHYLEWWVSRWEPTYREVRVGDLRSVADLADISFDAGVQLGAGQPPDDAVRARALASFAKLESRYRKETSALVEEMLTGWRELGAR